MLMLLFNLAPQPPSLTSAYNDFQLEAAVALGYGADSTLWTDAEIAEINRAINEAYRHIQHVHTWSWKKQEYVITTEADTATYTLTAHVGVVHGDLTYESDAGFTHVRRTSKLNIRKKMQQSSASAQPWLYTMEWAEQTRGLPQRQEVTFFPPPDDEYDITAEISVLIGDLSEENPYPLGGQAISQLMIEGSRAFGEKMKNGQRGDYWSVFEQALMQAVLEDKAQLTERTVGLMGNPDGRYTDYSIRSTSGSTYAGIG